MEAYRRILFVIAGLEPINRSEVPTLRYQRLLPFYVLGGMAGLRRRNSISSDPSDPVIEWTDIWWKRNLIEIREEVAKQTGAADHRRWPSLEPAAKEWLRMVAKPSGPIMEISQSTLQRLNGELLDTLKLEVPENGLRTHTRATGYRSGLRVMSQRRWVTMKRLCCATTSRSLSRTPAKHGSASGPE